MDDRRLMAAMAKALKNVTSLLKGTPFEVRASKLLEVVDIEEVERLAAEHEKTVEGGVTTRRGANMVNSSSSSSSAAVRNSSSSSSSAAVLNSSSSSSSAAAPAVSSSSSNAAAPAVSSSSSSAAVPAVSSSNAAAPVVSSSSAARPPVPSGGASSFAGPSGSLPSSSSGSAPGAVSSSSSSSAGRSAPKRPFSIRGSLRNGGSSTITKVNPQTLLLRLKASQPQRKRPRDEVERRTRGEESDDEEEEDITEAIRAVIEEHFVCREESADDREARRRRRTSMPPPPTGVAEAAEAFRTAARGSYAGRYVAAMRARRLRNALRREMDSKSKDPLAGYYWVAAGRKKKGYTAISLGHRYPRPAGAEVTPVESRTLPMTLSEWRYFVTLFGNVETFVAGLDGGDTEENWALIDRLVELIPWESVAALAPRCGGGGVNVLNFLSTNTGVILGAALEAQGKGKGKGKGPADQ